MVSLEVCANSITSALAAQKGGAARVELCENLHEGGTTPSHGQIQIARKHLTIPVHVLLRPRTGDFMYTDLEFEVIQADLDFIISSGCDGVAIGILNSDGTINIEQCTLLVQKAKAHGLHVTFHRAFDFCPDLFQALEDVIGLGCDTILTSGGKTTAIEGAGTIVQLMQKADDRIDLMPGGGISEYNVADLIYFTGAKFVQSSARSRMKTTMNFKKNHIIMGGADSDEYDVIATDMERVKQIATLANSSAHH